MALTLNAYFLGHALFQISLVRYAHIALPTMLLLAISTISSLIRAGLIAVPAWGVLGRTMKTLSR